MTDPDVADKTYIEPITTEIIEEIIKKEKPDAILPTMGGQTALNAAMALKKEGILKKYNIELNSVNSFKWEKSVWKIRLFSRIGKGSNWAPESMLLTRLIQSIIGK